jgi:serine/threonine protein kinase
VKKEWRKMIKEASGCSDILDFYELKEKLGEGQFGVVFKGVHLETKMKLLLRLRTKEKWTRKQSASLVRK